jgi:hypothetical protein
MSEEQKGSKPGQIIERHPLKRANTIPTVEFSIPPSFPEDHSTGCRPHQIHCDDAQGQSEKYGAPDEEAQSFANEDEITYPEGGLAAWLVVLGSFSGTIVAFGMM